MRRYLIRGGIILAVVFAFCGKSNAQVNEISCPPGTQSIQHLQTIDINNSQTKQNYCVDNSGNLVYAGNFSHSGTESFNASGSNRTFANPAFGVFTSTINGALSYRFIDNSPASTDGTGSAQGSNNYLPYLSINLLSTGAGQALPLYTSIFSTSTIANHTIGTSDMAGASFNGNLSQGARNSGVFSLVGIVGMNHGFTITNITCSAGTATVTTTTTHDYLAGDLVGISGNTVNNYNSDPSPAGANTLWTVLASGLTNTTFQFSVACNGTGTGGTVALDAQMLGEFNHFNNTFNPPTPTSPDLLNSRTKIGVLSINLGSRAIMADFWADYSPSLGSVAPYYGYLSRAAQISHYIAGFPCNTVTASCPVDPAQFGYVTKYPQVASGTVTTVNGFPNEQCDSIFSGGSSENCFRTQAIAVSTAAHEYQYFFNTTQIGGLGQGGSFYLGPTAGKFFSVNSADASVSVNGHLNQINSGKIAGTGVCAANVATITFGTAFNVTPVIVVFDETTKGGINLTAKSATAFTVSCTGATDAFDWIVVGNNN